MICFHCEDVSYCYPNKKLTKLWLQNLVVNEGFILGNINIIFTSDYHLLQINKQYLNRDYYTDIITFDYSEKNIISGDLFISIDRAKCNSNSLNISSLLEVRRLMTHGILHLCGYKDKSIEDKNVMTSKEDYYLSLQKF